MYEKLGEEPDEEEEEEERGAAEKAPDFTPEESASITAFTLEYCDEMNTQLLAWREENLKLGELIRRVHGPARPAGAKGGNRRPTSAAKEMHHVTAIVLSNGEALGACHYFALSPSPGTLPRPVSAFVRKLEVCCCIYPCTCMARTWLSCGQPPNLPGPS